MKRILRILVLTVIAVWVSIPIGLWGYALLFPDSETAGGIAHIGKHVESSVWGKGFDRRVVFTNHAFYARMLMSKGGWMRQQFTIVERPKTEFDDYEAVFVHRDENQTVVAIPESTSEYIFNHGGIHYHHYAMADSRVWAIAISLWYPTIITLLIPVAIVAWRKRNRRTESAAA